MAVADEGGKGKETFDETSEETFPKGPIANDAVVPDPLLLPFVQPMVPRMVQHEGSEKVQEVPLNNATLKQHEDDKMVSDLSYNFKGYLGNQNDLVIVLQIIQIRVGRPLDGGGELSDWPLIGVNKLQIRVQEH